MSSPNDWAAPGAHRTLGWLNGLVRLFQPDTTIEKLFTERHGGAVPGVKEELDHVTRNGVLTLVQARIDEEWFGDRRTLAPRGRNPGVACVSQRGLEGGSMPWNQVIWWVILLVSGLMAYVAYVTYLQLAPMD